MVDTNVLIYITVNPNPWYNAARQWLDRLFNEGFGLCISSQIAREYLVVLTRGDVFERSFTPEEAIHELDAILSVFALLDESGRSVSHLSDLMRHYQIRGKSIHDANIVATMLAHGVKRLATYNSEDFRKFEEINLEPISAS
jgi:predicted nucleic acid-binding protein